MNADVHRAVTERAGGRCEGCGNYFDGSLEGRGTIDHAWGRKHAPETAETCWVLCWGGCHSQKTLNRPSRGHWIRAFWKHCDKYGYAEQVARCLKELEWVHQKAAFAK